MPHVKYDPTFQGRGLGSIIDLAYLSTSLTKGMNWHLSEHFTVVVTRPSSLILELMEMTSEDALEVKKLKWILRRRHFLQLR